MKITKSELKKRTSFVMLGFFTFYLIEPIRELISQNLNINPILIGVGGILLTLYFFDF